MAPLSSAHSLQSTAPWLRDLLILAVLFGFLFCFSLGAAPLIDPDEGRYAEIPREMLERGDLITPCSTMSSIRETSPALLAECRLLKLFGQNEFAARLPSALSDC